MEEELQQAQEIYSIITEFLVTKSFEIVAALIILMIGFYVARKVSDFVEGLMIRNKIDITLSRFTASGIKILIIAMVGIMALGKIGISVTPFVAAIGALSLGAGLALQGLLSNYGAGISIIVTRPFVVGDTIKVQGVAGIVKEVRLGYTILSNEDETKITIPNKHIVGEIIHNSQDDSIVELVVGIAYHCDPEQAISVIKKAITGISGISEVREPQVGIDNFGDSSIDLAIRFWAKTEVLFQTKFAVNAAIHKVLAEHDIEIPFPQRDVRMIQSGATAN